MGYTVEHACPQCGAPLELDEVDRLIKCPFCGVASFVHAKNYPRFILPHDGSESETVYAPYLRFKGNVYVCAGRRLIFRFIDMTHVGTALEGLPVSLGMRPQAMKMRYVSPETRGTFLRFSLKASDLLLRAGNIGGDCGELLHRAYIGETLSIIYLPLSVEKGKLVDAIRDRTLRELPADRDPFDATVNRHPGRGLTFFPTLCPRCGWNLEGERNSVVLTCPNCETAWESSNAGFMPLNTLLVRGGAKDPVYLPFWKTSISTEGLTMETFSDFLRLTHQPRVIGEQSEQGLDFWSPAFKIRPKVFIRVARQFTVSQEHFRGEATVLNQNGFPVTLGKTEAGQSLKLILASAAVNKKAVWPYLPQIRFHVKDYTLVWLPFRETTHDMIQDHTGISINKAALRFGRRL